MGGRRTEKPVKPRRTRKTGINLIEGVLTSGEQMLGMAFVTRFYGFYRFYWFYYLFNIYIADHFYGKWTALANLC